MKTLSHRHRRRQRPAVDVLHDEEVALPGRRLFASELQGAHDVFVLDRRPELRLAHEAHEEAVGLKQVRVDEFESDAVARGEALAELADAKYVRTPDSVEVSESGPFASEIGHWLGTWTTTEGLFG